eukprot:3852476-Alexandrium_andersonii.AAC.1
MCIRDSPSSPYNAPDLNVPSVAIANRGERAQSQRHLGCPAHGSSGAGRHNPIAGGVMERRIL